MARHTPGPWTASERDRSYVRIDSDHWAMLATVVVRMSGADENIPSGEANARLIAAAPDLLDALKEFVEPFAGWDIQNFIKRSDPATAVRVTKARTAIAKAEGR